MRDLCRIYSLWFARKWSSLCLFVQNNILAWASPHCRNLGLCKSREPDPLPTRARPVERLPCNSLLILPCNSLLHTAMQFFASYCHAILCFILPCNSLLHTAMQFFASYCHAILCFILPCNSLLHTAMQFFASYCHAILCFILRVWSHVHTLLVIFPTIPGELYFRVYCL